MNNEPKKHHYLPQSYLKGFQIENTKKNPKIYIYEKDNRKTPYIAAIKDTACIRDYHTIKVNDKNDRTSIESMFSNIENEIIQNIRRVINENHISDDSKLCRKYSWII